MKMLWYSFTGLLYIVTNISYFLSPPPPFSLYQQGWQWVSLTLLIAVCSVLSKEQGVTVVAVCFTIDVFLIQKV